MHRTQREDEPAVQRGEGADARTPEKIAGTLGDLSE
jgi:hypothetical protein